ncbi:superinfection immunity protein [Flavobacterium sp.]|uniref:superinfection immunity protein n=1 Tax=Flavobacterium sp. TaxID=239 RepID=UPI0012241CFB|nr:MAG: superinfection immunity protein [Flavobacterium sp.]
MGKRCSEVSGTFICFGLRNPAVDLLSSVCFQNATFVRKEIKVSIVPTLLNANLPFENQEFTKEKFMALAVFAFVYFIPSLISRGKKRFKQILLANVFLGWTGIGWFGVLVWSLFAKGDEEISGDID